MPIEFNCSGCSKRLRVADQHIGKKSRCPDCKAITVCPPQSQVENRPLDTSPARPDEAASHGSADHHAANDREPAEQQRPAGSFSNAATPASGQPRPQPRPMVAEAASRDPVDGAATSPGESWQMRTADGEIYGPATYAELSEWAREGRVPPDARIRPAATEHWYWAVDQFPEIRQLFAAPHPQPQDPAVHRPDSIASAYNVNPYASGPVAAHDGYPLHQQMGRSSVSGRSRYRKPHRGVAVFLLSLVSLFVCPPLAIISIFMGFADLQEMAAQRMDPAGRGLTIAGIAIGFFALAAIAVGSLVALVG